MDNIIKALITIWSELESVFELFIYIGIAWVISWALGITKLQAVAIVFTYFIMNILRVWIERNR